MVEIHTFITYMHCVQHAAALGFRHMLLLLLEGLTCYPTYAKGWLLTCIGLFTDLYCTGFRMKLKRGAVAGHY